MTSVRVFVIGGLTSYRALFNFMNPWIFVPTLVVTPVFQILLFTYIGRTAGLEDDTFYVIGNALQYAAVPCLFAMTQTIAGERFQQTLPFILVSPARRMPLFFGRAVPVILNGFFVSAFAFAVSSLLLDVHLSAGAIGGILLATLVAVFSCTGLGFISAGIAFLVRQQAVLTNVMFGLLLIFTGANVPLDELPGWMRTIADGLPFTHAIEAARRLAGGATVGDVGGLLGTEIAIGVVYAAVGYALLLTLERESRRRATLERT